MSTRAEQRQAEAILRAMGDDLPASLRGPLRAVRDSTEINGTAADVLALAHSAIPNDRYTTLADVLAEQGQHPA